MLGELMCHLTGFIGLPFEVTFILIGILWFLAGWLISGRMMNNKWSSSVEFLDEELKAKVIKNVSNRRKRTKAPERTKSI